ncbi:oligoendopeptidase, pepF/M3 family [Halobacillus karajensis]|uniref:Oligoendopeptidase F, plasmid n=1 Tax=Halobacillus karajensis TaxID=195088 RepID=A0A024P4X5_9BACI|nr:M3 family oligoendopeptidase [Halobacillus karajensis]CDQ20437.1 Oligoendopeptidase F, plasmid [Halobacillus karajensis]CDQ24094.1 Oligoendopeptidase F, plasmid [Halobacillus karajensis]CDQ27572.1 Oligoendopeptidase F, plasmid [Halobacillus karajensis]SEH91671.1 oligoendopeptidase, pepF/M3 family [Halobacillus karajensis]
MGNYATTWDLDSIFNGGSDSDELKDYVHKTEQLMEDLEELIRTFTSPKNTDQTEELERILEKLQVITKQLSEFGAFVSCLNAQNIHDKKANIWQSKRSELGAKLGNAMTKLDQTFVQVDDDVWKSLMNQKPFKSVSFVLNERRQQAKGKLEVDKESLINDLGIDGYHAWGQMYDALVAKLTIQMDGEELSVGQAANKLDDPDRSVRKDAFTKLQNTWGESLDLFSETLNHLAGFRLQTYKHRNWENVWKEPLDYNRMSEKTLNVMWETITEYKKHYVPYMKKKAEQLGIHQLSFYDVEAPIGESEHKMSFQEGAEFIIQHFRKFSPKMADFAEMAFEKRWIEAEDRPGKQPGGFCTSFPDSGETRIFMTYSGSPSNVATLAHELGHAYHQHVMNDLPILNQGYAMNVAETASTFAEMIVADAAVKEAVTEAEKLVLLEDKVQRSVAFFMNIHARFLFETRFYKERKQGVVSTDRLNKLMTEAQREAYVQTLEEYDPTFWASKLHFHITDVPFYNFPYTFGYLFSMGIYARAQDVGPEFEEQYIALLQDTGRMSVEDLAEKHLGVDLEKKDFWTHALDLCLSDLESFMDLV